MSSVVSGVVQAMQFGQTQRYHTEILLKSQDVGQHSFNVAWLCYYLSGGSPSAALLMAALSHDAGERKTGDMPSPVKRAAGCGAQLDGMEAEHLLRAGYLQPPLLNEEAETLKVADLLEGCFFCYREVRLGNRLMLDPARGGAALNFMKYAAEKILSVRGMTLANRAAELYDYLRSLYEREPEYNEHFPGQ